MNIKASVSLVTKPGSLKGIANVSLDDEYAVKGIRIYEGEKGLFLSMPSRKIGEKYEDTFFPVSAESREHLQKTVLSAYEYKLSQREEQKNGQEKGNKKEQSAGKPEKSQKSDSASKAKEPELSSEGQDESVDEGMTMGM